MITAMFLAHFVGDFVLQWDNLAQWKGRSYLGVLAHCLVVFLTTWLFFCPFWARVLALGFVHLWLAPGN